MSQEPGPKTAGDLRTLWPWAAAVLWLVVVLVAMLALGGFRGLFVDHDATATSEVGIATEEAQAAMEVQQQSVAEAVIATLTAQPTPVPTDTSVPTGTPTVAPSATSTPAPSDTPVPDLTATWEAEFEKIAAAIAATASARPTDTPVPTRTPTETPDVGATGTAQSRQVLEAIAATASARPTDTPVPTRTPTETPDVGATEMAQAHAVADSVAATLTAQPTPTFTPIPALEWPIILADIFTSDKNGWPTGESEGPSGRVSQTIAEGTYRWDVDARQGLVVVANPSVALVGDFYVAVEGERASGPRDAEYGLVFRETDEDNLYSFSVRDDGRFGVFALTHGEWKALVDWTASPAINQDELNKLAVWGQGSDFQFFINDQPVAETKDSRFPFGEVGLLAEVGAGLPASFEFDTFELRASGTPGLPTPVPARDADVTTGLDEEHCVHADTGLIPANTELLVCDSFSSFWNVQDSNLDHLVETRTVQDGKYRWEIETEHDLFSQVSPSIGPVGDFYVSAQAQQISGAEEAEYSLMFRKVDDDNLYTFNVRHDGSFGVFGIRNGEWVTVIDWTPAAVIRLGEGNRLTIRAKGRRTVFFINDQRVAETSEVPPVEGEVGIAVELPAGTQAVFEFGDFELRTPDDENPQTESSSDFDASACSHDSMLAPVDWPVVFCNSFASDAVLNRLEWPLGDSTNEYGSTQRRIAHGRYTWDSEAYRGVFSPAISDLTDLSDFYLTVLGRLRRGPSGASYGVIFRRTDGRNYHFFEISSNGYYKLSTREDGEWNTLIPWTETDAINEDHEDNRITIQATGDDFRFFVNDEYVDEYGDDRFASGSVGLAIELFDEGDEGSFDWDNFEIRVPADKAAPEPVPTDSAEATLVAQTVAATLTAQPTATIDMAHFESRDLGVSLEFPARWSYFELGQDPPVVAFGWLWGGLRGVTDGAVLVVGTDDEFVDADINDLLEDIQLELSGEGMKLEIIDPRAIDDNAAQGVSFDLAVPESEDILPGQRLYGKMYVFDRKGVGYIVAALAPNGDTWKQHEAMFERVIDSIVLSDPITPTPTATRTPASSPTFTPTPVPTATPTATPTSQQTATPSIATSVPSTAPVVTPMGEEDNTWGFTSGQDVEIPVAGTLEFEEGEMASLVIEEWGMSLPYPEDWSEAERTESNIFLVEDPGMLEVPESEVRGGAIIVVTEDESEIPLGMSMEEVFVKAVDNEFHVDSFGPEDVTETNFGNKLGYEARFEIEEDEDLHAKFWGKLTTSEGKLILVVGASLRADEWDAYEPKFAQMFDDATFSE